VGSFRLYILTAALDVLRENPDRFLLASEIAQIVSKRLGKQFTSQRIAAHLAQAEKEIIKRDVNPRSRGRLFKYRIRF